MRPINYFNYDVYEALSPEEKIYFLNKTIVSNLDVCGKNSHAPSRIDMNNDDINKYRSLYGDMCNTKTDKTIKEFVKFCKSKKVNDRFILLDCIKSGVMETLKLSKDDFIRKFIVTDPIHVEGEIVSPMPVNKIVNQSKLQNPPTVIDTVAKEIDLNGQVNYVDGDNNTVIDYYRNTLLSAINFQENIALPVSHLKNLVEMLNSPVFKQTMTNMLMAPNEKGPDFTELRSYPFDKTKYNLCLTARTTDKRRNIVICVNTADITYMSVSTNDRKFCNKCR